MKDSTDIKGDEEANCTQNTRIIAFALLLGARNHHQAEADREADS